MQRAQADDAGDASDDSDASVSEPRGKQASSNSDVEMENESSNESDDEEKSADDTGSHVNALVTEGLHDFAER